MKKAFVLLVIVISALSCKKLKSLADIKFSVPNTQTVSAPGLPGSPFIPPTGLTTSLPAIGVESKSEEYIKKYNASSTLITSVKLGQLKMELAEPQSQTFDILDSIWVYMTAPGQSELLAAHYYNVPKGVRTLDLVTSDANIKEYFLQDSVYFRIQGHFYKAPDSTTTFTVTSRFDAVANPLNNE